MPLTLFFWNHFLAMGSSLCYQPDNKADREMCVWTPENCSLNLWSRSTLLSQHTTMHLLSSKPQQTHRCKYTPLPHSLCPPTPFSRQPEQYQWGQGWEKPSICALMAEMRVGREHKGPVKDYLPRLI